MPTSLELWERGIKPKVEASVRVVKIGCHLVAKQILHRVTVPWGPSDSRDSRNLIEKWLMKKVWQGVEGY